MNNLWCLILLFNVVVECVRLPLSYDSKTPFLRHSVNANINGNTFSHETVVTFSWSNVFLGKLLHKSELIEVGPRGVRFIPHIFYDRLFNNGAIALSKDCFPSNQALCKVSSNEGWILPSEGLFTPPIFNITSQNSLLQDDVMRAFASGTACHNEEQGAGRAYSSSIEYSITSCDILHGKMLIVYHKTRNIIVAYPQSFGPIAYFLILLSATISTGGITYLSQSTKIEDNISSEYLSIVLNLNALSSIIVCASVLSESKIHFHTLGDELVFWSGIWSGSFYTAIVMMASLFYGSSLAQSKTLIHFLKRSFEIDSCMYALKIISIALYRTPENPYTSILSFYYAFRLWEKVFIICHGRNQATLLAQNVPFFQSWLFQNLRYVDLILNLINFNLICEVGMKPQYISQEIWIFYFTILIFITYCLIKYQWMIAITAF